MRQKPIFQDLDKDWKYIEGYEGLYSVSERGEVWSCRRKRYLAKSTSDRYFLVSLSKNNKKSNRHIHSLVAEAFIGKRPLGYEVNHKDANRLNNHLTNLEYVTHKQNSGHAALMNLYPCGSKNNRAKVSEEDVLRIRRLFLEYGISRKDLAKKFGLSSKNIGEIIRRIIWKHI